MKPAKIPAIFFVCLLVFSACASQKKIVFRPSSVSNEGPVTEKASKKREIIESQNGFAGSMIPNWVNRFLEGGIKEVEALSAFEDMYVFIGENRGSNFNALRQWADGFTVTQDLPRLVTRRIEQRLVAAASLYPDDEYGEYFEALIKSASNADYPGSIKQGSFWIRQRIYPEDEMDSSDGSRQAASGIEECYEFFVLIRIEKTALQSCIRNLMAKIKTSAPPTREQSAAINHIQHNFFEGF
ncbi:MAG: hypothetical protein LBD18_02640 [Treponema sp.]|jgi:hypothetical protein|nr:hypothetical protein [Treponema sp.]